jgi:RimJ/RimL family protein N-acetyltransferase
MRDLTRDRGLLTSTLIRGRRVTLRHNSEGYSEEEIARRYRWSLDQELQYWSGSIPAAPTLAQFRNDVISSTQQSDYRRDQFAILDEWGSLVGMISYYNWIPPRGQAELGIYIGERNLWDKGYGTEAVRTLMDHLFQTTPLRVMYLNTYANNERARASYTKVGFETVGTTRKYSSRVGYYIDVQMRMSREDFIARYGLGLFVPIKRGPVPRRYTSGHSVDVRT